MANKAGESLYSQEDIETVERLITVGITTEQLQSYVRQLILEHPTATTFNRRRASTNLRDCIAPHDVLKLMVNTRNAFNAKKDK